MDIVILIFVFAVIFISFIRRNKRENERKNEEDRIFFDNLKKFYKDDECMYIVIYFLEKINYNEISDFNRLEYKRNFLFISILYLCRSLYLNVDSKNIKSIFLDVTDKIKHNEFILYDINKVCVSIYKKLNYNESKYTDLSLSDLDNIEYFMINKFDTLDSNYIDRIFTR